MFIRAGCSLPYWSNPHPLGHDETEHDGNTERDVSGTLDDDDGQADGHTHGAAKLAGRAHEGVLGDVHALKGHRYGVAWNKTTVVCLLDSKMAQTKVLNGDDVGDIDENDDDRDHLDYNNALISDDIPNPDYLLKASNLPHGSS